MNVEELRRRLDELGVPQRFYTINGHLASDTYILNWVHSFWEYFYFDEKGQARGVKRFESEEEACAYFYQRLKDEMKYYHPLV